MKTDPKAALTRVIHDSESPFDTRPLNLQLYLRLFRYTRPYAWRRNLLVGLVLLRSLQLPFLAWAIGAVLNGPVTSGDVRGLWLGVAGYAVLALFTELTFHFRFRLGLEMGEAVVHDLRRDIYATLMRMPMSFYNRTKVGRILSRFTSDAEAVRVGVQNVVFVGLVQLGHVVIAAALMLYYDRVLFGVVAAMVPAIWLLNRHFRGRLSRAYRAVQESFSRVTATVAESVRGIRITQSYVRQDRNAMLFRDLVTDHSAYSVRVAESEAVFLPLMEVNGQFFLAALILLGGIRAMSPETGMPVGHLVQFFFLSGYVFGPIQTLATLYNQALTAMAGAERVFQFLDSRPEWEEDPEARPLETCQGRVEFQDVSFGYQPDRPVVSGVSFRVEPGQTVALVGHTGSGKTTLVNLLAKFYPPGSGRILVDGRDMRLIRGDSLRRHMGIVLQQNFLFTGTVLENVLMGRPDAGEAGVREAARQLDCLDLLEALPEGLHTRVGEQGLGLSLGQRQLVCFTRAMLANPHILILDEATSSVDSLTEQRLQIALSKLVAGRTSFIVAHRLSTIRHADLVLVLDRGRIAERGTHRQLLRQGGIYAALYREFMLIDRETVSRHTS